jgi:hypothetical protein
MANTKKLSKDERKAAKRKARRQLATLYQSLDKKQRAQLTKEKLGIKKLLAAKSGD